jgi:hypothetical protein
MATYNKHFPFAEYIYEGVMNLGGDTLKVMLTNVAPTTANGVKADLTDITAQNGYSAGGTQATISSSTQTSGTYKLVLADVVFTASGGSFGPFQYADLYDDTPSGTPTDPLIGWWNYGSSISINTGETFTWDADATNGILTHA